MQKANLILDSGKLLSTQDATIAKILPSDEPNKKLLEVVTGKWEKSDTRFLVDEDGANYTLLRQDTVANLSVLLKMLQDENFDLKLEKAILQHMPIDYDDVVAVVKKEVEEKFVKKGKKPNNIKLDKLLFSIKKAHPNLFYNMQDLFK